MSGILTNLERPFVKMFASLAFVIGLALLIVALVYFSMASCTSSTELDELLEVKEDKEAINSRFFIAVIVGFVGIIVAGVVFGIPKLLPVQPDASPSDRAERLLLTPPPNSIVLCRPDVDDIIEDCIQIGVVTTDDLDQKAQQIKGLLNTHNMKLLQICSNLNGSVFLNAVPRDAPIIQQADSYPDDWTWTNVEACNAIHIKAKVARIKLFKALSELGPEKDVDVIHHNNFDYSVQYNTVRYRLKFLHAVANPTATDKKVAVLRKFYLFATSKTHRFKAFEIDDAVLTLYDARILNKPLKWNNEVPGRDDLAPYNDLLVRLGKQAVV